MGCFGKCLAIDAIRFKRFVSHIFSLGAKNKTDCCFVQTPQPALSPRREAFVSPLRRRDAIETASLPSFMALNCKTIALSSLDFGTTLTLSFPRKRESTSHVRDLDLVWSLHLGYWSFRPCGRESFQSFSHNARRTTQNFIPVTMIKSLSEVNN